MTTTGISSSTAGQAIATEPDTSPAWWFLGTLAVLRNPPGAPRTPAVMELTIPPGGSPPLHVHETLDDSFLLLDGEVVVRCGQDTVVARPGSYVVMPHGVAHTFRVTGAVPARMVLVHADDSFLTFVEEVGTPITDRRLPPPEDSNLDFEALARASAAHGAPMIGPSLEEDEARSYLPARPDTTDLVAVHRVFRDALADAPRLIGGTRPGDDHRVAVVASYYDNILRFLKVHHEAEDDLVWPKLLDRSPTRAGLVKDLMSEHEQIHTAQERAGAALARWTATADADSARDLTAGLAELGEGLLPHLDTEDEEIIALCAENLSAEEWGEMPGHALHAYDGDKIWLILGLIRENMTQAQRDAMLDHMPPPPREMWINFGNAAFDEFIAEIRGFSG